jgi:citrate lyase subunit beta/citryl-CoA lyase
LLFVPGDDAKKLTKAREVPADALVIDWEDAVLPSRKTTARTLTHDFLVGLPPLSVTILIRFNSAHSAHFEADCDQIGHFPFAGVLLSKCQSPHDILSLEKILEPKDPSGRIKVYALIESAAGLFQAGAIATSSQRIAGLAFGAEDFSADVGITRTPGEPELIYARCTLVTACHAFRLEAIDTPYLEWRNEEKLRAHAQAARNLGFTGKLAIHPSQVPILNEVLSPSRSEIETAQKILAAFSASGAGVTTVDGVMVDAATVRRAHRILRSMHPPGSPR